jgi:hypothetical protein
MCLSLHGFRKWENWPSETEVPNTFPNAMQNTLAILQAHAINADTQHCLWFSEHWQNIPQHTITTQY